MPRSARSTTTRWPSPTGCERDTGDERRHGRRDERQGRDRHRRQPRRRQGDRPTLPRGGGYGDDLLAPGVRRAAGVGRLWFSQRSNAVMQEQDSGGSIVNISSMASVTASPGLVAYGAAKAGLNHFTRSLAVEWGPKVRVNCIALGTIQTEALDAVIF